MKRILAICALLFATLPAAAATYNYAAPPYTAVTPTGGCPLGDCQDFTTSMQVRGSFSTATPLAPGLVGADITAQVVGFSFNDGLVTYARTDPQVRAAIMTVDTDASGNVTNATIIIEHWQTPGAHVVGDRVDLLQILVPALAFGGHNVSCTAVGVAPSGQADSCLGFAADAGTSIGTVGTTAAFTLLSLAKIPTLGDLGLVMLALAMAGVGVAALRRS
jgi:hypothetical protein